MAVATLESRFQFGGKIGVVTNQGEMYEQTHIFTFLKVFLI